MAMMHMIGLIVMVKSDHKTITETHLISEAFVEVDDPDAAPRMFLPPVAFGDTLCFGLIGGHIH